MPKGFTEEPVTAKFNAAFASLERLHELLDECNQYSRKCHLNGYNLESLKAWRFTILAVYREVRPKLVESEMNKLKKMFKKFKDVGNIVEVKNSEDGPAHQINPNSFNKYWRLNSKIETELRVMADSHGLLIPNSKGSLDALDA